jgi:hypothetical protein
VSRLRPTCSGILQPDRSPGHLSSLSRPISRFFVGCSFSLAKIGRVLLTTACRGIDCDGVSKGRVVCGGGCGPVCTTVDCSRLSVAERVSSDRAKRWAALARHPKVTTIQTVVHVSSLLLPRGRDDDPVGPVPAGRRARPRAFLVARCFPKTAGLVLDAKSMAEFRWLSGASPAALAKIEEDVTVQQADQD